jgi:hypothetical protein
MPEMRKIWQRLSMLFKNRIKVKSKETIFYIKMANSEPEPVGKPVV